MVTNRPEKSAVLLRIFRNVIADNSIPFVVFLFIECYERSGKIRNDAAENPHYYCKFFVYT